MKTMTSRQNHKMDKQQEIEEQGKIVTEISDVECEYNKGCHGEASVKLSQQKGYQRLAKFITIIAFVFVFIVMLFKSTNNVAEALIAIPIASAVVAGASYVLVRLVYWVIDGFRLGK